MSVPAMITLAVLLAAALVVGVRSLTRHAAVGVVPRLGGLYEVCGCGAERPCGHGASWYPRLGKHS